MPKQNGSEIYLKTVKQELQKLNVRREKLQNLIQSMESLEENEGSLSDYKLTRVLKPGRPNKIAMDGIPMSITSAIKSFLYDEANTAHSVEDIYQAVVASGVKINSDKPKTVISTTLYRLKNGMPSVFVQPTKGYWQVNSKALAKVHGKGK